MKILKKTIATMLMAAMLVSVMPQTTTTVLAKSKVHSTLKKGTLTISGKGKMPSSMTFQKNRKIKKVVIKSGVTSISNKAFYKCSKLTKVTIAKSVKEIGIDSFNGTALKTATVPSKVKTIGQDAFSNCKNLKNITLPGKFDVKVKSGDSKNDIISNLPFDTVKLNSDMGVYIVEHFKCNNLQVADNDMSLRSVDGVVYSNDYKELRAVPSERTSLVINSKCQTIYLYSMVYATETSSGCTGGCSKLSKITIPGSVKKIIGYTTNTYVNHSYLPLTDIDFQVESLDDKSVISLASVLHPSGAPNVIKKIDEKLENVTQKDGLYIVDKTALRYTGTEKKVTIPEGINVIGDSCFENNQSITEIVLSKSVDAIMTRAFKNCTNLSSVKILESGLGEGLLYLWAEAFMNTGAIDKFTIKTDSIGEHLFANSKIKQVELVEQADCISDGMFRNCSELQNVIVGDGVRIYRIGKYAFENCTKFDFMNILDAAEEINEGAFKGCKWDKLPIRINYEKCLEKDTFKTNDDVKKNVIVTGDTINVHTNAFPYKNTTLTFKDGIHEAFCGANILKVKKQKKGKVKVTLAWAKVTDISGYQVKVSTDSKFKKKVSTYNYKSSKTSATVTVKNNKKKVYVKIRPYKTSKGKKSYGRWAYANK